MHMHVYKDNIVMIYIYSCSILKHDLEYNETPVYLGPGHSTMMWMFLGHPKIPMNGKPWHIFGEMNIHHYQLLSKPPGYQAI